MDISRHWHLGLAPNNLNEDMQSRHEAMYAAEDELLAGGRFEEMVQDTEEHTNGTEDRPTGIEE